MIYKKIFKNITILQAQQFLQTENR